MARGNYYGTSIRRREDGVRIGTEAARQAKTQDEAKARVEARGTGQGYVQVWSDRTQSRTVVATLRNGVWYPGAGFDAPKPDYNWTPATTTTNV